MSVVTGTEGGGDQVKIKFAIEKPTKNTIRYAEQARLGDPEAIGTLYVQKSALKEFGEEPPEILYVEITAG